MAASQPTLMPAAQLARRRETFVKPLAEGDILLLRATLLDGDVARSAYTSWKNEHLDLVTITPPWTRMLPLLQYNLTRLGVVDPLVDRARGVRRYIWADNLKSMTLAQRAFKALRTADVPTILFKGIAIIVRYLRDRSLRSMDDIDILVPYDRYADAVAALDAANIRPRFIDGPTLIGQVQSRSELIGWPFRSDHTVEIDVHWHATPWNRQRDADDEFWNGSQPIDVDGMSLRTFDPADHLLHLCAHAVQPGSNTSLRWVSDAFAIMRGTGAAFSWQRLQQQAARHRVSLVMADSLRFLVDVAGVPVPADTLAALDTQVTLTERLERRLAIRARTVDNGRLSKLLLQYQDFRRGPQRRASNVSSFSQFVQEKLGADSLAQAVATAVYDLAGRPRGLHRLLDLGQDERPERLAALPALGEALPFTSHSRFAAAFGRGWSYSEMTGRWTLGHEARLAWRLDGLASDLIGRIELMAATSDMHRRMVAEVWANDVLIAEWRFEYGVPPATVQLLAIPAEALRDRPQLTLSLVVHQPKHPVTGGPLQDERALGLQVRALTFAPSHVMTITAPDLGVVAAEGWHSVEAWGVWSAQTVAVMRVPLRGRIEDAVMLEVSGRICVRDQTSGSNIVFRIAGRVAGTATTPPGRHEAVALLTVLPVDVSVDRDMMVELEIDRIFCPAAESLGSDMRSLGFGLERLAVLPIQA